MLAQRFDYIFRQNEKGSGLLYRPFLAARTVSGPFAIGGLPVTPFRQQHGMGSFSMGYRLGPMAYSTDVVGLDETAFAILEGLDLWIVDCLRFEPHPDPCPFRPDHGMGPAPEAQAHLAHPYEPFGGLRRDRPSLPPGRRARL